MISSGVHLISVFNLLAIFLKVTTYYNYPYVPDLPTQHEDKEVKIVDLDAHGTAVLNLQPPLNCTGARVDVSLDYRYVRCDKLAEVV